LSALDGRKDRERPVADRFGTSTLSRS